MYEESQRIHRDYRARLLELDDDRYYQEIERAYQTYGTPPVQDYRLRLPVPTEPPKNLCRYSVRVGDRHVERNFMNIDLSEQEQGHYRVTYRGK